MNPEDLVRRIDNDISASKSANDTWKKEARESYDFVAGHQFTQEELSSLEDMGRESITFNRLGPMVDAVAGYYTNNPQEVRYLPVTIGDSKVNDMLSDAVKWLDESCDAPDELEDVFGDMVTTGMGWCEIYMDYTENANGDLKTASRIDPLEMNWDHRARKRNLSDARWVARTRWWDWDDAVTVWPQLQNMDPSEMLGGIGGDDLEDGGLHEQLEDYPSEQRSSFSGNDWYNAERRQVRVTQYQWQGYERFYRTVDPASGRIVELSDQKFQVLQQRGAITGRYIAQQRKRYYQAFKVGPMLLGQGYSPCMYGFTLRCVTGKRDALQGIFYGLVRQMRDPQRWSNKLFMDLHEIVVANRRGGAFVEEDALVDPRKAEEDWNANNPLIMTRRGALSQGKIQERQPAAYPQSMDRLLTLAVSAIPDVTGINPELMGLVSRDQPGIVESGRKQAALNILATLFSNMGLFIKQRGKIILHMMIRYLNDGRLTRVTQDGQTAFQPLQLPPDTIRFDVIVDDAPASVNRKQETFLVLRELIPALMAAGIPIPPDVMDYLPLPASLVEKWKQWLMQAAQKSQMKPEQVQMLRKKMLQDLEEQAAGIDETKAKATKTKADTVLSLAKAKETGERVKLDVLNSFPENTTERKTQ